jgi:hypothetical protein
MTAGENLELCLDKLRNAKEDEEILFALALLPQLLDRNNVDSMTVAFESIPWKFVHRLLISRPEQADSSMQSLGVHIWTSFCIEPFYNSKAILKRMEPCSALLHQDFEDDVKCLIIETIIFIVSQREGFDGISDAVLENVGKCIGGLELQKRVLEFIGFAVSFDKVCVWMLQFCINVMKEQSELIFEALERAAAIVCCQKYDLESNHVLELKEMFKRLLRNKLGKSQIGHIIFICAVITEHPSFFRQHSTVAQSRKDQLSDSQLLVMLTHLTGAEIRLSLDDSSDSFEELQMPLLPLYFDLLERIMIALIDEIVTLNPKVLESILTSLKDTYMIVQAFLLERFVVFV